MKPEPAPVEPILTPDSRWGQNASLFLETLLNMNLRGVGLVDERGVVRYANPGCRNIYGANPEEIVGRHFREFYADPHSLNCMLAELRKHGRVDRWPTQARRADGQAVPVEITLVRLLDSDSRPLGSVALIRDARQPQELVDQLQQQELELIRLNRNLELACLDQTCQGPRPFLVALADVDGFKSINDHWGHQVGDAYLIELARAWLAYLQGSEILAHLGGDEFAYLCYRPLSILRLIRRQVEPDLAAAFPEIPGGLSLGYAQFHPWSPAAATLLAQADRRLYRNKQRRRRTARR